MTRGGAEHRADRRAAIKQHHPDRGGSAEALDAALAAVDRRHSRAPDITPNRPRRRHESPVTRVLHRTARRVQRLLPRSVRGSRRYVDL